jgi:hypothetical protein
MIADVRILIDVAHCSSPFSCWRRMALNIRAAVGYRRSMATSATVRPATLMRFVSGLVMKSCRVQHLWHSSLMLF